MTNMTVSEIQHTAYHEAGHAVAAHAVGREFRSVSIVPDDDSLGRVLFEPYGDDFLERFPHGTLDDLEIRRKVENEIITAYGGEAASMLLTGEPEPVGAEGDRSRVLDFVIRVSGSPEEAEAYGDWLWCRTKAMLGSDKTWPAVEAVASALLDRKTLSSHETRRIIRAVFQESLQRHLSQARKLSRG